MTSTRSVISAVRPSILRGVPFDPGTSCIYPVVPGHQPVIWAPRAGINPSEAVIRTGAVAELMVAK